MLRRGLDKFRRPELILTDLLRESARGDVERAYRRAVVLAVDTEGGLLQNEDGRGSLTSQWIDGSVRTFPALVGPDNPRGAIKARVLTDGLDRLMSDDEVRVFWPLLPHDQISLPIAPGEHVYVIFEGEGLDHGLWISRVSGHDSANVFNGAESYDATSSPRTAMDSFEPRPADYETSDDVASLAPRMNPMTLFES